MADGADLTLTDKVLPKTLLPLHTHKLLAEGGRVFKPQQRVGLRSRRRMRKPGVRSRRRRGAPIPSATFEKMATASSSSHKKHWDNELAERNAEGVVALRINVVQQGRMPERINEQTDVTAPDVMKKIIEVANVTRVHEEFSAWCESQTSILPSPPKRSGEKRQIWKPKIMHLSASSKALRTKTGATSEVDLKAAAAILRKATRLASKTQYEH